MLRNFIGPFFIWAKRNINFILFSFFICSLILVYRLGSNSFWIAHDNLNSEIIFKILPVQEDVFFEVNNEAFVDRFMGKIPKCSYSSSPFSVISWFFYLFPASFALLIVSILGRVIAFSGIYFLLNRLTISKTLWNTLIIFFLSFGFASLPFYSIHGWAISGLPWCIFFILRINSGNYKIWDFIFLLLYGMSGSFVLGGFAVIAVLCTFSILCLVKRNPNAKFLLLASLIVAIGFVLSDLGLFYQFLFQKNFVSHRSIWKPECNWSIKVVLYDIYNILFNGQYHAPSLQMPFVYFLMISSFFIPKKEFLKINILVVFGLILVIAIFHGFYKSELISPFKVSISILNQFQFDRFYFLYPVLWVLLFFLIVRSQTGFIRYLALATSFCYAIFSIYNNEEWKSNISGYCVDDSVKQWRAYYYENIKDIVAHDFNNSQDYRVIHFGMDPAIGCYLGFKTIDGYHTNYPIEIKNFFAKIIQIDLKENSVEKTSLIEWGSNLRYFPTRPRQINLDWNLAKSSKVKYVLSRYSLMGSEHLKLAKKYFDLEYNQALYVYELI